jgi:hypothetical protein
VCMRCRRVRASISPRVPRKVSFTGQDESVRDASNPVCETNARSLFSLKGNRRRSSVRFLQKEKVRKVLCDVENFYHTYC